MKRRDRAGADADRAWQLMSALVTENRGDWRRKVSDLTGMPFSRWRALKRLVDALNITTSDPRALLVVPLGLLLGYAGLRLAMTLFTELREIVFSRATFGAAKRVSLETFEHLHALSLRFHLERKTGGLTRVLERAARASRNCRA